ncbi:MAG: hypothetical protein H6748_20405 [Spirochaetaceae bacterium]|nr:hypothetical protein [Myxococcales bacterium]MCB9726422.1 hypothetical protein [Spirochaetaceae bacterium]
MLVHAAAVPSLRHFVRRSALLALCATPLLAGAALAGSLPGIDLSEPAEPVASGECSRLVQIKYPFLSCRNGEIGAAAGDETWDSARRLPLMSDWTEGDAAWGPELNLD